MTAITYNNITYPALSKLHAAIKPQVTLKILNQRFSRHKKAGISEQDALHLSLKTKPTYLGNIKCRTCKTKKPTSEYAPHPTSLTGHATKCETCRLAPSESIEISNAWQKILGSKPFGNIRPLHLNDRLFIGAG